jgi:DNA repair protein RadC
MKKPRKRDEINIAESGPSKQHDVIGPRCRVAGGSAGKFSAVDTGMRLFVMEKIAEMPASDRPREKLIRKGVGGLSDAELMAVLVGSGNRQAGVERIAAELLGLLDARNSEVTADDLRRISGIGSAKAALILAALEFSRRRLCPDRRRIGRPADILPLIAHYEDRKQEHFICVSLNGAHEVIALRVVSVGLLNRSLVHPREVYADPLIDRAAAIIVAHNHPSGNVDPSPEDREVTRRLAAAGETLGIKLLDHVIFGIGKFYSFLEHGEVEG